MPKPETVSTLFLLSFCNSDAFYVILPRGRPIRILNKHIPLICPIHFYLYIFVILCPNPPSIQFNFVFKNLRSRAISSYALCTGHIYHICPEPSKLTVCDSVIQFRIGEWSVAIRNVFVNGFERWEREKVALYIGGLVRPYTKIQPPQPRIFFRPSGTTLPSGIFCLGQIKPRFRGYVVPRKI